MTQFTSHELTDFSALLLRQEIPFGLSMHLSGERSFQELVLPGLFELEVTLDEVWLLSARQSTVSERRLSLQSTVCSHRLSLALS